MKLKSLALCFASFMLIGCATVKFNPETGEVKYTRIGDQHIQGFEMEIKQSGDVIVRLKGQQSNAEALTEAIRIIGVLSTSSTKAVK